MESDNVVPSTEQVLNETEPNRTEQNTENGFILNVEILQGKPEENLSSSIIAEENANRDFSGQDNFISSTTAKSNEIFFGLPVNETLEEITSPADKEKIDSPFGLPVTESFSQSSVDLTTLHSTDSNVFGHQTTQKFGQPQDENVNEEDKLSTKELVQKIGESSLDNDEASQRIPSKQQDLTEGTVDRTSDSNLSSTSSNKESTSTDPTIKITTLSGQAVASENNQNQDSASGLSQNFNLTTLGTLQGDGLSLQLPEEQISSSTSSQTDSFKFTILEAEEFTTVMSRVFDNSASSSVQNTAENIEVTTQQISTDVIQAGILNEDTNGQRETSTIKLVKTIETTAKSDETADVTNISRTEQQTAEQVETIDKPMNDSIINEDAISGQEKLSGNNKESNTTASDVTEASFSSTLTSSVLPSENKNVEIAATNLTNTETKNENETSSVQDLFVKITEGGNDGNEKAPDLESLSTTAQPVTGGFNTEKSEKQSTFEQEDSTQKPVQISEFDIKKKDETTLNDGSETQSNFSTTNAETKLPSTTQISVAVSDNGSELTTIISINEQSLQEGTTEKQSSESNGNFINEEALNKEEVASSDRPILSSTTSEKEQFGTTATYETEATSRPTTEQSVISTTQSFREATTDEIKKLKTTPDQIVISSTTPLPDEGQFQEVPLIIPANKDQDSSNRVDNSAKRKDGNNSTTDEDKQTFNSEKEQVTTEKLSEKEDFENTANSNTTEKQDSINLTQLDEQIKEETESKDLERSKNESTTIQSESGLTLDSSNSLNQTSTKISTERTQIDLSPNLNFTLNEETQNAPPLRVDKNENVSSITSLTESSDVFQNQTNSDILTSSGVTEAQEDDYPEEFPTITTQIGSKVENQSSEKDSELSITTIATKVSDNTSEEEPTTEPILILKSPQVDSFSSSPVSASSATTFETTTPASEEGFSSGLFERVRDILLTLAAGLMTQAISFPVLPSRRGDAAEPPTRFSQAPIIRDPSIRKKIQEENFSFSGNTLNLTIPIQPSELDNLRDDTLRQNLTNFATDTFKPGNVVHDVGIILDENEKEGKIIITAQRDELNQEESDQNNFRPLIQDSKEQPQSISTTIRPISSSSFSNTFDDNYSENVDQSEKNPSPVSKTNGQIKPEQSSSNRQDERNEGANDSDSNQTSIGQQLSTSEQTPAFVAGSTTSRQEPINFQTESSTQTFTSTTGGLNEIKFELGDAITRPTTSSGSFSNVPTTSRTPGSTISTSTATSRNISQEESSDSILGTTTYRNPSTTGLDSNDLTSSASDRARINNKFNPELSYPQPPPISNNGINETQENEDDDSNAPALPVLNDEEFFGAVSSDDDRFFDSRINILGGSSANIVQATVVEDLNFARSVRDSSIGIATISSITVGVIALLGFGLLIFLALARRRRMRRQGTSSMGSPMVTPTQSRTTFSGSPIMGDTPSLSDTRAASYLDDPINTSSSAGSSLDPVLPLDGHGTIVTSYDDYMSLPENARSNIFSSLAGSGSGMGSAAGPSPPPPPLAASESVPRTRNLTESSDFLFSRSPPPYNPYPV